MHALIYSVSGGLFGVGIGCGQCSIPRYVFAGTSDAMYCLISEELGILMGIILVLSIVLLAVYACTVSSLRNACFSDGFTCAWCYGCYTVYGCYTTFLECGRIKYDLCMGFACIHKSC